tara:strand:+ start:255 stop:515 length:261 start_codon:yes stop_codon:yes gene_type:complete
MSECCNECDYWEDRIDMYIDNQIKESKLNRIAKKNLNNTKLLIPNNIKASGGKNKAGGVNVELKDKVYRVGNVKVIAKVGTTSSHK